MGDTSSCCNDHTVVDNVGALTYIQQQTIRCPEIPQRFTKTLQKAKNSIYYKQKGEQTEASTYRKIKTLKMKQNDKQQNSSHQDTIYDGQVLHNKCDGHGRIYFPNALFEGNFVEGKPVNGIFIVSQNIYYVGDIKNYEAYGDGQYCNEKSSYKYDGKWSKNMPHGIGKQNFSNGDSYQGQFMYGSKFGQGTYKYQNGNVYKGQFYNGLCDGFGILTMKNGDIYQGQWKLGKMHGNGKWKWKDNYQSYEGGYFEGKKSGKGVYKFSNGSVYQGQWKEGFQHGAGTIREGYDEVKGIWQMGERRQ